eukprot:767885-Hanusia_phi.AAC.9
MSELLSMPLMTHQPPRWPGQTCRCSHSPCPFDLPTNLRMISSVSAAALSTWGLSMEKLRDAAPSRMILVSFHRHASI